MQHEPARSHMRAFGYRWQGRERYALGLVCLTMAALLTGRLAETPIGAVTDDAHYIEMSRSIAEGRGPAILIGPEESSGYPATFPPGFPYLLSPIASLMPDSLGALRVVPLIAAFMLLPLALAVPGDQTRNDLRLAVGAVVVLNPWIVAWAGRVLSDLPYTALSLLLFMLFLKWTDTSKIKTTHYTLMILLSVVVVSVRTVGWAAVLAMAAVLLSERRFRRTLALLVPTLVLVLAVQRSTLGAGLVTPGYFAQMLPHTDHSFWRFGLENLLGYVAELPVMVVPVFGQPVQAVLQRIGAGVLYPALAFIVGSMLLLLVGAAAGKRWRRTHESRRVRLYVTYAVFYAAALSQFDGYPSGVQTRLLIPVMPIIAWLLLTGIDDMFGPERRRFGRLILGVLILAALTHNGWRLLNPLHSAVAADGQGLVDPGRGAERVARETGPEDVVMVQDTLQRHIHWRRPVVAFPDSIDAREIFRRCRRFAVSHIFVGPTVHHQPGRLDEAGESMLDTIRSRPDLYHEVLADTAESIFIFTCESGSTPEPESAQP